jgi:NAD(P)-dependent dehydrogenase (short-subunit alcohol dehydrogenase family)
MRRRINYTRRFSVRVRPIDIAILCLAALAFEAPAATETEAPQDTVTPTVLITGSSRGIGLEFTRQYARLGWTVIATCRSPDKALELQEIAKDYSNVTIDRLDVTDHDMIDALAEKYRGTPIDILLNNAGINPSPADQMLGSIDYDLFRMILETNTIGPMKMSEAFMDSVRASEQKKIMTLSSGMGSIENSPRFRGVTGPYRVSKAGVNMAMRVVYASVGRRGVIVGILDPGLVDTDQAKTVPLEKMPPEVSVAAMIKVIDNFDSENSGSFIQYDGEAVPW